MDKRESPTPEQLRLYRRRKKILQKKRRQRRRALVAVAAVAIVVVVVLVAVLSGSFEKRSNKDMLTLESDGTVVFEENGDMKDAKGLKQFVKSQIMSYNNTNGAESVKLERYARDGDHYYVRTRYKDLSTYSDFTGYEAFDGTVSEAQKAGYDFDSGFKTTTYQKSTDTLTFNDASADAFKEQRVFIIKEWGIKVKIPETVSGVSLAGNVQYDPGSDTVTIAKQSDSGTAPLTYIFYR